MKTYLEKSLKRERGFERASRHPKSIEKCLKIMQSAWKLDFQNLMFDIYPIGPVDPASLIRVFGIPHWDSKSRN